MFNIHLIEKTSSYYREGNTNESDIWVSGTWAIGAETADELQNGGGNVYLHTEQDNGCYLGGEIISLMQVVERKANKPARFDIRFRSNPTLIGTMTNDCNGNWSVEMLLDRR